MYRKAGGIAGISMNTAIARGLKIEGFFRIMGESLAAG